jgi:hypothetical protein
MAERERQFPLDARLANCELKNAAIRWPLPIDDRLDTLVEAVEDVGERTTRKELAAAILLAATESPDQLSQLLRRYRTALVRDASLTVPEGENVVSIHRHKPGPRPRRSAT